MSSGEVGTARLDGFTLIGGNAIDNGYFRINGNVFYREFGGGMYNSKSSPGLTNVTINGNTGTAQGGGMYNYMSYPNLINVALSRNTSPDDGKGGGMYNSDSSPNLTNVTIIGNKVDKYGNGGGMYNYQSSPSLHNSIVYANRTGIANGYQSTPNIDYSLVQEVDNTANNGLDGTNISLAIFNDPTNGDYNLISTSPAIDAGDNTAYTNAGGNLQSDVDLAGNPRLQNSSIDMGAYENSLATENERLADLPNQVELRQNYPNPFNPSTNIAFGLPESGKVTLEVFDMLGRKVATLLNKETKSAGRYSVQFDAGSLASGLYIYRLVAGSTVITKKLTLIK